MVKPEQCSSQALVDTSAPLILTNHHLPLSRAVFFKGLYMKIDTTTKSEHLELIAIWESSVRATHGFLSDENIYG